MINERRLFKGPSKKELLRRKKLIEPKDMDEETNLPEFNKKCKEIMEGILKGTSKDEKEDRVKAKVLRKIEEAKSTGKLNLSKLRLTTLKGFGLENLKLESFDCSINNLTSLEGAPKSVSGKFECYSNLLTSLNGAPKSISGNFSCADNGLTSLKGAPKSVGGYFVCSSNELLSLEGAPKSISGNFYCGYNELLTSLKGAPESVGGDFNCSHNAKKFTEEEVRAVCNVKGKVYV